jgi:DNA polymerase Ligase (LigD)
MNRFVILEHDHPELHWDLMLECGDALRTWRLVAPPCAPGEVAAVPLGDHRKTYLGYEGPVSGDRGHVKRWDRGTYEMLPADGGGRIRVRLAGERIDGVVTLLSPPASRGA